MKFSLASLTILAAVQFLALSSTANAHYLWVKAEAKPGEHGTAHVYYEEGPAPGDGQYLDPFVQRGTTWIRTVKSSQPTLLKMVETKLPGKRWLSAELPAAGPRSIDSYGKWGVYRYGNTDVLLHYYARFLDAQDHDDLHELARAEQMALDIVAHDNKEGVRLTVLWQGEPAAGRQVIVRGPKGAKTETLATDEAGKVSYKVEVKGIYSFRTNIEEKKGGKEDDKEYQLTRHHGSLTMQLPLGGR